MRNVVKFGACRAASGKPEVIGPLEACVGERLTPALRDALIRCDDVLFGHAQQAMSGMRQAQYFDDMRQLRLSQDDAVSAFAARCRSMIQDGFAGSSMPAPLPLGQMQLVADEELELDLALLRVGQRCEEAAPRLRHQVQRRLEIVYGLDEGNVTPLGGVAIAAMCRAAMARLDISLDSRLIVLKQIERALAAEFEGLLESANALLLDHGILPNLRAAVAATTRDPATNPRRVAPADSAASAQTASATSRRSPAADLRRLGEALTRTRQQALQDALSKPPVAPTPDCAPTADRERLRREIEARRAAERQRARELRANAERIAHDVVSKATAHPDIPDGIRNAVRGPLRRHLEAVHARRGETSTEWRSACKLVRDIAWALDPETAASERAHWRAMVPGIVTALRAALTAAGADDAEVDRVVAEFGQRHEEMLADVQTEAPSQVAAESATDHPPAVAEDPKPTTPTHAPSYADVLRQVRQLTLGRWFELVDDQGRTQRAKLVWTSAMTERCLFVNGQGKLVADRPHARVANDILGGQFREIESGEAVLT